MMNSNRALSSVVVALSAAVLSGGAVWASSWSNSVTPKEVQIIVDYKIAGVLKMREEDLNRRVRESEILRQSFNGLKDAVNAIENQQVKTNVILEQIQRTLSQSP